MISFLAALAASAISCTFPGASSRVTAVEAPIEAAPPEPVDARSLDVPLVVVSGGRVLLGATADLLIGAQATTEASVCIVLVEASRSVHLSKEGRRFCALLETLTTPVTYEAHNADELLPSLGVPSCPPLESYVEKLVEYVKEHVRRRRATKVETVEVEDPLG